MFNIKKILKENKFFLGFIVGMVVFRSAFADYYTIPSSSMYPNLLEGDRVISNRIAYDFKVPFTDVVVKRMGEPERGDIVTFISPENGLRLIKRLVAIPGDVVEMRGAQLIINGQVANYQASDVEPDHLTPRREFDGRQDVYIETLGDQSRKIIHMPERVSMRDFGPVKIAEGEYLMLGDNRDNSKDSRYIGLVKREALTGRVRRTLFSLNPDNYYIPRVDRFIARVQ